MTNYLDSLSYKGKRVVVTGAASGMGEAGVALLAELGAEIIALDVKPVNGPVAQFIQTDLGKEASVDAAVAAIDGQIDVLLNFAGLPGAPFPGLQVVNVNYSGHVHLTEKLLPRMNKGGAITSITSLAGMAYLQKIQSLMPGVMVSDFKGAAAFAEANVGDTDGYALSKELLNLWTLVKAKEYGEKYRVRINAIAPCATLTPLYDQFTENAGGAAVMDFFSGFLGGQPAQPIHQAWPAVFLASGAASFVSGQVLNVDAGVSGALFTGQIQAPGA